MRGCNCAARLLLHHLRFLRGGEQRLVRRHIYLLVLATWLLHYVLHFCTIVPHGPPSVNAHHLLNLLERVPGRQCTFACLFSAIFNRAPTRARKNSPPHLSNATHARRFMATPGAMITRIATREVFLVACPVRPPALSQVLAPAPRRPRL